MISLKLDRVKDSTLDILKLYKQQVAEIDKAINEKTGEGNDFLGWTSYPNNLKESEINCILDAAKRIKDNCDVLVVIGIGGSYLGARAAIDAINGIVNGSKCKIVYLGNTLSPTYTSQVIKSLEGKKVGINVISKSGTTTEPAIALRLALEVCKKCWGDNYYKYVIATTDASRGALYQMAVDANYERFVIPDDVGGRYSVFTPVGLLPMAVAGLDIKNFIDGARDAIKEYGSNDVENNIAYKYALIRHIEYSVKFKTSEFLISYEPQFAMLAEWWKQLFGESEGKDKKGLLPASLVFTTDLHSMGQFCQEGSDVFFETTIRLANYQDNIKIPSATSNLDNLDYLVGKNISVVNDAAITSTLDAHYIEGKHDNVVFELTNMDEYHLGNLMFMFCKACAMSAYLNKVNPFNQPGVEIYKARMKALLKEIK